MFGFAGIQYMTAQGDPQGMSRAKMSVIGAVVGLAIAGLAFVMPGIISRLIVEPAGGQNVAGDSVGDNCDQLLKNQLVFQRGASTEDRMQEVIRQIQAQRDNCVSELWSPTVLDANNVGTTGCWANAGETKRQNDPRVGDLTVPTALFSGPDAGDEVRTTSGRDSGNNIIVYWSAGAGPSDSAVCWLFVSRLNQWDENY